MNALDRGEELQERGGERDTEWEEGKGRRKVKEKKRTMEDRKKVDM